MTLLSICQSACTLAPVAAPAAIVANTTDETAVLLLSLAQLSGQSLARRPTGGWVSMIREYNFTTTAIGPMSGTIANVGNGAVISGLSGISAIQPNIWQASGTGVANNAIITAVSSSSVTINQPASTTGAGVFTFGQSDYPLPSDFQRPVDNTFWDRTRYWQMRGPQSPQQWQVYKSSVIGRASIQRRFRFRSIGGVGHPYLSIDPLPLDNGSNLVFEYVSNAWCESASGTPQTSWQADTDVGVLDEYLLTLDVQWRLLRRLGMSYSEELSEFEAQASKAVSLDGGAPVLDLTPNDSLHLLDWRNVPETGYGV